jgi:hypothetical protein
MTETPLVKINFDPPEKLTELYGIGPKIASKIVERRNQIGAFQSPSDLAQVEGISEDLALTLAPSIDWQLPQNDEQDEPNERSWLWAIVMFIFGLSIVWIIINRTLPLFHDLTNLKDDWLHFWIDSSILIAQLGGVFTVLGIGFSFLMRDKAKAKKTYRISIVFAGILVFGILSTGLANAISYQFFAPNGWIELTHQPLAMVAVPTLAIVFIIYLPTFILLLNPKRFYSSILARIYDIGILLFGPLIAISVWFNRSNFPLWILIIWGSTGLFYAYMGFIMIRYRTSFFETQAMLLDTSQTKENNSSAWQAWINIRLPDPEQQKVLMEALNKAYPQSKFKTIVGLVVVSSGGWLVLTALSAVVQWLIEKGLDKLWPY